MHNSLGIPILSRVLYFDVTISAGFHYPASDSISTIGYAVLWILLNLLNVLVACIGRGAAGNLMSS